MEALLNNLIQATGWSILHSLWQAALIYALLLPSQMPIFQLKAKVKYNLSFAANAIIFLCFVITFILVFKWPSAQVSSGVLDPAIADQAIQIPFTAILAQYTETIFPFLVLLYGIGLLIQSIIVFKGYIKIQNLRKAARVAIPEEWNTLFDNLTRKLNISKHISFHLSNHVNVPLVIGFIKPVVLFPVALAAQMDMKHVEAILIHELSHIRRNDYLFNLIRTMIETILFFNPFIWLIGKFIDIEREHACDDLVVTLTKTPLTYAHALLQVELLADKSTPAFALAATGKNQHLYQRIKRITDMKTNYMNAKQKLFAVMLTLATITSLAWISPAKKEIHINAIKQQRKPIIKAPAILLPVDTGKKKIVKTVLISRAANSEITSINGKDSTTNNYTIHYTTSGDPKVTNDLVQDSVLTPEVLRSINTFTVDMKDMIANVNIDQTNLNKLTAELKKRGAELEKNFNTSEQKAKWARYGENMKKKYNSPQERAKWEKTAKEMEAKYNSPAEIQKISILQSEAKTQVLNAQRMLNSPEFKKKMRAITINGTSPLIVLNETEEQQKIKQTPEYQELKKKFDADVEKLKAKELKKENN
ncbi:M56 family metallopeptidase [Pedobacter sp. PAMC26386]|nr:M56 family metallopeptidase [Pedobacter sp. PAMC26386]